VFVLVALSIAAAQMGGLYNNLQKVPIIQYKNEINYDGTYRYKYVVINFLRPSEKYTSH